MPLLRAYKAKHAKPSKVAPALMAGGLTATLAVADASLLGGAASASAPSSSWDRLAQCESGGNWSINTGNGYYGGLQFDLSTWRSVGGSGRPDEASRSEQIRRANILHSARGFKPWPACSRKLNLRGGGGGGSDEVSQSSTRSRSAVRASRSRRATAAATSSTRRVRSTARVASTSAPAYRGVLSTRLVGSYRTDVAQWQRRMAARGWTIAVDGRFGPQSSAVARAFAAQKGLRPAVRGTVDRTVFRAAWTLRVG